MVKSEKVLVVGTFRSEQLAADVEGRPNPLVETIRLMRRQDLIKEINVKSLDQSNISELANNMLGGNLQQELAQKLSDESQGNPLFVVESLRMLDASNSLVQENNRWRLTNSAIGIPLKIKDIILQRLGVLSGNHRNVLNVASVIGEKFDVEILSAVLGQDLLEVIQMLDTISKNTSLVWCEGELYRFDHARTKDALYDDISPALKRVYHGKVAAQLEILNEDRKVLLNDLAYHFSKAGNKEKAITYSLAAGEDALSKWSNTDAVKEFSFVVDTIGVDPKYSKERIIALEGLGDAYFASNNFKQAITILGQVADLQDGADKLRVLRKALQGSFYLSDLATEKAVIQKIEGVVTTNRLEAARVLYLKTNIMESPSDWLAIQNIWPEVLKVFEEEYALNDAANILLWLGFGQACIGKLELGVSEALRSIALYDDLGDFRSQMEAYAYAGGSFQACLFNEDSNRMLAKAIEVNEKYKIWDYVRLFPAYVWEAMNLIQVDIPGTIAKAKKALEYFEKTDSYLYAGPVYGILIIAYALADDVAHVDEYFGKFMNLPKDVQSNAPTQIYLGPTMLTYYAAKGEYEKSEKAFNDWMNVVKTYFSSPFVDAGARQLYAWGLGKQGKFEEAKFQLEEAQKVAENSKNRFSHVNIIASIMTQTRLEANQTFPVRFDLVNVSTNPGSIVKIENLPKELKIVDVSPNCVMNGDQIEFKDNRIDRFSVKTVKLTLKAPKVLEDCALILNPQITFVNDLGETKTCNAYRPLELSIRSLSSKNKGQPSNQASEHSKGSVSAGEDEIEILKRFGLTR